MKKRILSFLLVFVMLASMLPVNVFAAGDERAVGGGGSKTCQCSNPKVLTSYTKIGETQHKITKTCTNFWCNKLISDEETVDCYQGKNPAKGSNHQHKYTCDCGRTKTEACYQGVTPKPNSSYYPFSGQKHTYTCGCGNTKEETCFQNPTYEDNGSRHTEVCGCGRRKTNQDHSYTDDKCACGHENNYTVEFVDEDGTVLQTGKVSYGETPAYSSETPTKEATAQYTYTFTGWQPALAPVTEDVTYTATYKEDLRYYDITFVDEDEEPLKTVSVAYGETPNYGEANPEKEATEDTAYTFGGWEPALAPVTGEATYKATYTSAAREYTITFVDGNGTEKTVQVEYGQTPVYPDGTPAKNPTVDKVYTFAGWDKEIVPVTEDATYTATFEEDVRNYKITFKKNSSTLKTIDVPYGEMPVYDGETPTTNENGKVFAGWDKELAPVTGDATYYATFAKGYTITFKNHDGTVLQTGKVAEGTMPVYKGTTPTKTGNNYYEYEFIGWRTENGWSTEIVSVTKDATYIAQFKPVQKMYTVKFVNEDGTVISENQYKYNATVSVPTTTPTKASNEQYNYTFAGWNPETIAKVTKDATYTATYTATPRQYTVTFKDENGTPLSTESYAYGTEANAIVKPEDPTKAATTESTFTFAGWTPAISTVTGDAEYTATYTSAPRQYTVTFKDEEGTVLTTNTYVYGTAAEAIDVPDVPNYKETVSTAYEFAGWTPAIQKVTGNAEYTATYTPTLRQYTIKFVNEDGTVLQSSEVTYGEMPVYSNDRPEKEATAEFTYTFDTWTPAIQEVNGPATYTATFTSTTNTYTVLFVNDDGTVLQSSNWAYGATPRYEQAKPTKEADAQNTYEFAGWDAEIAEVTGTATYTATYTATPRQYTVTFKDEDGATLSTASYAYGTAAADIVVPADPTKAATTESTFTFAGWTPAIEEVTGEATYTATYTPVTRKYTVTFMNGTDKISEAQYDYGTAAANIVVPADPTKAADAQYTYTFAGWNPELADVTGDVTYAATYNNTLNKYTVTFVDEDGTELQSNLVAYGETPVYSKATPTKESTVAEDYTFAGWDAEIAEVTGDATYKATYTSAPRKYIVTFNNEDGTLLSAQEYAYGTKADVIVKPAATKTGDAQFSYVFAGWDPAVADVTGPATYTAQFTENVNSYPVTFKNYNGTVLKTINVEYGSVPSYSGANPTRASTAQYTYTFAGWDRAFEAVTGPAEYTAQFTENVRSYAITFKAEGKVLKTIEVEYDKTPVYDGETPTKESTVDKVYTFAGWTPAIKKVTGEATYTAKFTESTRKYTVKFVNDDGSPISENEYDYNTPWWDVHKPADPTKEGNAQYSYTFDKWTPDIAFWVKSDATYTATYKETINKYKVTFKNEDGTVLQHGMVAYGETPVYSKATPTKADKKDANGNVMETYTFAGWDKTIAPVEGAVTYTATYTPVISKYTVKFVDENGTELKATKAYDYGTAAADIEKPADPTKAATPEFTYTFAGWDPAVEKVTKNVVYKATYKATVNKYTITFKNEAGAVLQSDDVAYGQTPEYKGATPIKAPKKDVHGNVMETYTFAGWTPEIAKVTGKATYTARFTPVTAQYTVTFVDENGTELKATKAYDYGTAAADIEKPADPTKAATPEFTYTFAGWTPEVATVTKNATYKATYTAKRNSYTVTFQDDAGNTLETVTVEYGKTPVYPNADPEKAATAEFTYTFAGWDPKVVPVTGNATYKAKFDATTNEYTIKFVNEDGTELQNTKVKYGEMPNYAGATPTKEATAQYTYTFKGWDKEISTVTGEETYKATYDSTVNKYKVTFKNEDGTVLISREVEYGKTPEYTGKTPAKAKDAQYTYTFAGWDKDFAPVTEDVTYTAKYEAKLRSYTIKFVDENGTELQKRLVKYGEMPEYKKAEPTKKATDKYTYTFAGWEPEVVAVVGDATYKATYDATINKYTIKFVNEDGTELQSSEVEYDALPEYTGATPTKVADAQYTYTFKGWDKEISTVTGDATYTATYDSTVNKYTVTFKDDNGTVLQSGDVAYGETPVYSGATPTKANTAQYTYTFEGWTPEITTVTGDVEYIATYSSVVNKYTVKFVNNYRQYHDKVLQSDVLEYGAMPNYTGDEPTRMGNAQYSYKFAGWKPAVVSVVGNATYEATFDQITNKYTVTFKNEDGTVLQTGKVEYGTTPEYKGATPTKAKDAQYTYTFAGWDKKIHPVRGDVVYTATYNKTVNEYTIKFVNDNGRELQNGKVAYGKTPVYKNATPTKAATAQYTYTFKGWDPTVVPVTGDATYKATYKATVNKYTVTFKNEDGTVLQTGKVEYGTTPEYKGKTPTKAADVQFTYTFKGWDKYIAPVSGDVVYTATYKATVNKYTVTFKNDDGTVLSEKEYDYGTKSFMIVAPKTPTKAADVQFTYVFKGWDKKIADVTGDVVYTATYHNILNKYKVTFKNEDGTVLSERAYDYGTKSFMIVAPKNPTKAADVQYTYTFAGWDKKIADVTGDVTYTATYKAILNKYTIKFVDENSTELQSGEVAYGETPVYTGATPTKEATAQYTYTFDKWTPDVVAVVGDATYTATYSSVVNKYKVTFVDEDGTVLLEKEYEYGTTADQIELPEDPTKEADAQYTYTFVGWDKMLRRAVATVTEDVVYRPVYEATVNQYTVTFVDEDDTVLKEATAYDYGTAAADIEKPEDPTKAADVQYTYTFAGWDPEVAEVTANAIYKAVYDAEVNQYTVTFVDEDGTVLKEATAYDYGTAAADIEVPAEPTKAATAQYTYTFAGWDAEIAEVTGDVVYTATYTATVNKYTVKYVASGKVVSEQLVEYGSDAVAPTVPAIEGYYGKWNKDGKNIVEDTTITAVYYDNNGVVRTGDDNNPALWAGMMFSAAAGMCGIAMYLKKKKEEE